MWNFHYYVQEQHIQYDQVFHQLEQEICHDIGFEKVSDLLRIVEVEMHKHLVNLIVEYYENSRAEGLFNSNQYSSLISFLYLQSAVVPAYLAPPVCIIIAQLPSVNGSMSINVNKNLDR